MGYQPYNIDHDSKLQFFIGLLLVMCLVYIVYLSIGISNKCPAPECGKWWARISYDSQYLNTNKKQVHDTITHYYYDTDGNITGSWIEFDDYVRYTEYYKRFNNCKFCNAKWTDIITNVYRRNY